MYNLHVTLLPRYGFAGSIGLAGNIGRKGMWFWFLWYVKGVGLTEIKKCSDVMFRKTDCSDVAVAKKYFSAQAVS